MSGSVSPSRHLLSFSLIGFSTVNSERSHLSQPVGLATIAGLGLATGSIQLYQLLTTPHGFVSVAFGSGIPFCLSGVLVGIAVWLRRSDTGSIIVRTATWCLIGALVLVGVSATSFVYQLSLGVVMTELGLVITNHATVGALLGVFIGLYDGQRATRGTELKRERTRAQQLSDRLSILHRVIRHDIRNAVTVIRGHVSLLEEENVSSAYALEAIDEQLADLQAVSAQAKRIETLFERQSQETSVDLAPIVRDLKDDLSAEWNSLVLLVNLEEPLQVATPPLIEVALDELLRNAIEHNTSDHPTITVSAAPEIEDSAEGPDWIRVEIRDDGPGIPRDVVDVLDKGRETALTHTDGIGLWVVHWIVNESGGQIDIRANEPDGSVVELRLPAAEDT